jgi:Tfp pilus assembly protein PilO
LKKKRLNRLNRRQRREKAEMSSTNRVVVAMLIASALVIAFWTLALGPKREEATKLEGRANSLQELLAIDRQQVELGLASRKDFAADYSQLVVLGKAVPADDDTASLLVQINHIADDAGVRLQEVTLKGSSEPALAVPAEPGATESAAPSSTNVAAPTEAVAASMPLGASIGSAGLAVMPYSLEFTGDFMHIADFIEGLDRLVKTTNSKVAVDGRLITIDGFSLGPQEGRTFPMLEASFAVTTYLVPEDQGLTPGAAPSALGSVGGTPAAAITEGTP